MNVFASLLLAATLLRGGPELPLSPAIADAQPHEQYLAGVAAGAEQALVVWRDSGPRNESGVANWNVTAARIDRDGRRLDARPIVLFTHPRTSSPSVARGDREWLVVWSSDENTLARIVRDDGTTGPPVTLATGAGDGPVTVAWNGSHYLVAWPFEWTLQTALVDSQGNRIGAVREVWREVAIELGTVQLLAAPDGGFVLIVPNQSGLDALDLSAEGLRVGRRTLVANRSAWVGLATFDDDELVYAWMDVDGVHVRRDGETRQTVATELTYIAGFVSFRGRVYLLLRKDDAVVLHPVDGGSGRTWPRGRDEANMACVASFGDRLILAVNTGLRFHRVSDVAFTILGATLDELVPQQRVYEEPRLQLRPAVARTAEGGLTAWIERRELEGRDALMGRLLDRTGTPAGAPFLITEDVLEREIDIATDGRDFLVTWREVAQVWLYARRVLHDGTMPQPAQEIGAPAGTTCAMWDGSAFVLGYGTLVWVGREVRATEPRLRELRADGTLGEPVVLAVQSRAIDVACAAGRESSLFVWDDTNGAVRGVVRTKAGALTAEIPMGIGANPAAASNGEGFVAAWVTPDAIERVRVSALGTVEPPLDHSVPAEVNTAIGGGVALSASGSGYSLAWGSSDLYAMSLAANGEATSAAVHLGTGQHPKLDANVLAYERNIAPDVPGRWRAFVRTLGSALRRRVVR